MREHCNPTPHYPFFEQLPSEDIMAFSRSKVALGSNLGFTTSGVEVLPQRYTRGDRDITYQVISESEFINDVLLPPLLVSEICMASICQWDLRDTFYRPIDTSHQLITHKTSRYNYTGIGRHSVPIETEYLSDILRGHGVSDGLLDGMISLIPYGKYFTVNALFHNNRNITSIVARNNGDPYEALIAVTIPVR